MKKKGFTILISLFAFLSLNAQEKYYASVYHGSTEKTAPIEVSPSKQLFSFDASPKSDFINKVSDEMAGKHFLGTEIAKMEYSFQKMYSYQEAIAPGNSATKKIIRKPDIYFSVKKIEGYLKKQLKQGKISLTQAQDDYGKVLDVALNVMDVNTDKLESRLNSVGKNDDALMNVFVNEVELKNLY